MDGKTARGIWSFDRTDHWFLRIMLALIAIGAVFILVGAPVMNWINGDPVPLDYSGKAAIGALDGAGVKYDEVSTTVQVPVDGVGPRVWSLVPGVVLCALVLTVLWMVFALARSISRGEPFSAANVQRFRIIAVSLLVGSVLVPALGSMSRTMIGDSAGLDAALSPAGFSMTVPLWPIAAAFLVLLVGEAFAAGDRMREDLEGVI